MLEGTLDGDEGISDAREISESKRPVAPDNDSRTTAQIQRDIFEMMIKPLKSPVDVDSKNVDGERDAS